MKMYKTVNRLLQSFSRASIAEWMRPVCHTFTYWVLLLFTYELFASGVVGVSDGDVYLGDIPWASIIDRTSLNGNFFNAVKLTASELIYYAKILLNGIALFVLLWIGAIWVLSFGEEAKRTEWKWKLILVLMALVIINVPEVVYRVLTGSDSYLSGTIRRAQGRTIVTTDPGGRFSESDFSTCNNFLFCPYSIFNNIYIRGFFYFIEGVMVAIAIIMFTYGGIKLMFAAGKEDEVKNQRYRFIYGGIALLIVAFIEWLYRAVFIWGIVTGDFQVLIAVINLFLFFVGPIGIIMIIVWAYYYITSGGSQERAEKGKKIVLYTFLGTILLILSYTLLVEIVAGITFF